MGAMRNTQRKFECRDVLLVELNTLNYTYDFRVWSQVGLHPVHRTTVPAPLMFFVLQVLLVVFLIANWFDSNDPSGFMRLRNITWER